MILKRIIVVIALLAVISPCCHAAAHHGHDHDAAVDLCALDAMPCECHSCDQQPCSDNIEIQTGQVPVSKTIEHPSIPDVNFIFPEPKLDSGEPILPVSGVLVSLQTIQLLI